MANRYLGYTDESAAAADLRIYARTVPGQCTVNKLPMFSGIGPTLIKDSAYAQADNGRQIIIGIGATVNAGQVSPNPIIVIGDGATGWGIGAIAIGRNCTAGQTSAKDGAIAIGNGTTVNSKNAINIGSQLAFGVAAGDDSISIGTQVSGGTGSNGGIGIGRGATFGTNCVAIGYGALSNEQWSIAIGYQAGTTNSGNGTASKCIAIGYQAAASVVAPGDQSAIAIGRIASALGRNSIAIGFGASVPYNAGVYEGCIAIGYGATVTRTAELVFGDNVATKQIQLVTVRSGANVQVLHRSGGTGGWGVRNNADTATIFTVDESAVAEDMRLLLWDVTGAVLKRVTRGAANSGGAGFRQLLIAN